MLDKIAQGEPFDTIEAIRQLAAEVTKLHKLLGSKEPTTPGAALETAIAAGLVEIGIPLKAAAALTAAGYETIQHLTVATDSDLAQIEGIGPGAIALIRRKLAGKE